MPFLTLGLLLSLLIGFHLPVPLHLNLCFSYLYLLLFVCLLWLIYQANAWSWTLFGVVLGIVICSLYGRSFYANDFIIEPNQQYQLTGIVANNQFPIDCSNADTRPNLCHRTLLIAVEKIDKKVGQRQFYQPLIVIRTEQVEQLIQKGDKVSFSAKLNRPLGYENSYGFNYAKWAFANGIYGKGKTVSDITIVSSNPSLSQRMLNKVYQQVKPLDNSAYFYPLLFAERGALSSEQKQQLQVHGLSHLFAISGLHIGVLYLVIYGVVKCGLYFQRFEHKRLLMQVISITLVWTYVWLIAMPVPATRAALLVSIWLLMSQANWHFRKLCIFCLMLVSSLLLQPTGVLDISWWLSVWAVAGIFVFNRFFAHKTPNESEFIVFTRIRQAFYFQWFIGLWLLPLSIYWFSGTSISGLWLNLLLVPLFCFVLLPCLFVASAFVILGNNPLSTALFYLVDKLFALNQLLLDKVSFGFDWYAIPLPLSVVMISLLVCWHLRKILPKPLMITSFVAFALLVLTTFMPSNNFMSSNNGQLKLYVFDVGQGTSILVYRHGKGVLYDLGPVFISGFSATKAVVAPNLLGLGISELDRVIISHWDSDHFGDIQAISHLLADQTSTSCPEQTLYWQQTRIERLWPRVNNDNTAKTDNDLSCVLKITDQISGRAILLTGDISRQVELDLVELHQTGQINLISEVLFSPHHGSKYSSSYPFLKAVQAKYVIHTAGAFNHFNFPTKAVKDRVQALQMQQFSTSSYGQLTLSFSNVWPFIRIKTMLTELSPFWKKQNPFSFQVEIR